MTDLKKMMGEKIQSKLFFFVILRMLTLSKPVVKSQTFTNIHTSTHTHLQIEHPNKYPYLHTYTHTTNTYMPTQTHLQSHVFNTGIKYVNTAKITKPYFIKFSRQFYFKLISQGAFWKNNSEGFPILAKFTNFLAKSDV